MIKERFTLILDIDGTLIKHHGDICSQHLREAELLPGVREKLIEWDRKRYRIILITGRRESVRKYTEKQLGDAGIFYDHLIMGASGDTRILLNDKKPNSDSNTAVAINVVRNAGLEDLKI